MIKDFGKAVIWLLGGVLPWLFLPRPVAIILNVIWLSLWAVGPIMNLWANQRMDSNSRDPVAWYNGGNSLLKQGRYKEALSRYDRALELSRVNPPEQPGYGKLSASLESLLWLNKGVAFLKLRRRDEALVCYDRALELDQHNGVAWFNKGLILIDLERLDEALQHLTTAERLGFAGAAKYIALCQQRLEARRRTGKGG